MRLGDLDYDKNFYWKGKRYVQFMRPRNKTKGCMILCYAKTDIYTNINMPSGRQVKPVLTM